MKTADEKKIVTLMIRYYYQKHGDAPEEEEAELLAYAMGRLDKCPHGARKPACSKCRIHCYKPVMREKIRQVMRYSGPRMLFRHPLLAIRHLLNF